VLSLAKQVLNAIAYKRERLFWGVGKKLLAKKVKRKKEKVKS